MEIVTSMIFYDWLHVELTITLRLYIRSFATSSTSWFPSLFLGGNLSSILLNLPHRDSQYQQVPQLTLCHCVSYTYKKNTTRQPVFSSYAADSWIDGFLYIHSLTVANLWFNVYCSLGGGVELVDFIIIHLYKISQYDVSIPSYSIKTVFSYLVWAL